MGVSKGLEMFRACTAGGAVLKRQTQVVSPSGAGQGSPGPLLSFGGGKAGVWACCHEQDAPLAGQEVGPGCRRVTAACGLGGAL